MLDKGEVKVSWSNTELSYINFFESTMGTGVIDCVMTNNDRTIFFLIKPEDSVRIRHNCKLLLQHLTKRIGKEVYVVEFHKELETFLRNAFHPIKVLDIQVGDGIKGGKVAYITVDEMDKGRAIGKNGFRIEGIREIVKRHFGLNDVKIK